MRLTTDEALSISTQSMNQAHCFEGVSPGFNFKCSGKPLRQECTYIINFEVSTETGDQYVNFKTVEVQQMPGFKAEINCIARLDFTPCKFGGRRWWLRCPMLKPDGRACNRRAGVLYYQPVDMVFACRQCCRLVYASSRRKKKTAGKQELDVAKDLKTAQWPGIRRGRGA